MKTFISMVLLSALSVTWILGKFLFNGVDRDVPDPVFLAQDLLFGIGEVVISVPAVAVGEVRIPPKHTNPLPSYRLNPRLGWRGREFPTKAFKVALLDLGGASEPSDKISRIQISLGVYGSYGERSLSKEICPRLTKEWSKKACLNQLRLENNDLPKEFRLATAAGLKFFLESRRSVGLRVDLVDVLGADNPTMPKAKVFCIDDQVYCDAIISVWNDVYAVWPIKCSMGAIVNCENASQEKGMAIYSFVRNSLWEV